MSNIKYPEQIEKLKEMRKSISMTATMAAEIVRTDLRNWQRWEAGESQIPEGIVELFCIRNGLNYKKYAKQKSEAQIERDKKRKEKFMDYKAKILGAQQAHGLSDNEMFDEKIEGIDESREKIRHSLLNKNPISELNFSERAKDILELFKNHQKLIPFIFDEIAIVHDGETLLSDISKLDSREFKILSSSEKLLVKLARNLWNGEGEISLHDVLEKLDRVNFSAFIRMLPNLRNY